MDVSEHVLKINRCFVKMCIVMGKPVLFQSRRINILLSVS
jgi:hypothetical protein